MNDKTQIKLSSDIHVELPDIDIPSMAIQMDRVNRLVRTYERKLIEFALRHKTLHVYEIRYTDSICEDAIARWDLYYAFFETRKDAEYMQKILLEEKHQGSSITEYDFMPLVQLEDFAIDYINKCEEEHRKLIMKYVTEMQPMIPKQPYPVFDY